ncbi:hypothetical protein Tco_0648620 [Tanacetum coccineum]
MITSNVFTTRGSSSKPYILLKQPSLRSWGQRCLQTDHPECWMEVEEEVVIEMTQKRQRLLKFQRDLLVVVEEEDEVGSQMVF